MALLKSKPLKSEKDPTYINLLHEGVIFNNDHTHTEYEVKGTVFSVSTNTKLEVHKRFEDLNDAEKYFEQIITEFPTSEIILKSNTIKELKIYV